MIAIALLLAFLIYICVGIACLYEFGTDLTSNVLDNVDEEVGSVISYIIRFSFLIVLACHIPYIFFTGKEAILIIILETTDRRMSKALEAIHQKAVIGNVGGPKPIRDDGFEELEEDSEIKKMFNEINPVLYYCATLGLYTR